MRWLKRNLWKIGLAIAVVALLVWMAWISLSVVGMQSGRVPASNPNMVQGTPTLGATATVLAVDVLKQQDDKAQRDNSDFWPYLNIFGSSIGACIGGFGTICLAFAAFLTANNGLRQWQGNRQDEQEKREKEQERWQKEREEERRKRDEERFQSVVEGLGSGREEARVGAAIMLRTFLQEDYKQFHSQAFDLAVAHLRLPRISDSPAYESAPPSLSQALIAIFKEAFPLVRSQNTKGPQSLDATGVQLDRAYLREADLKQVWMPRASLQNAQLSKANLTEAALSFSDLGRTDLRWADLTKADLFDTYLDDAILIGAVLHKAKLMRASLHRTNLEHADLSEADLTLATLMMVDLRDANLSGASLEHVNLIETNLLEARSLKDANLHGVEGLTPEQRTACKAKGAIIDEDPTTGPSQSIGAPPSPPPSNGEQTSSAPSAQGSLPPPDTDESSAAASQQDSES